MVQDKAINTKGAQLIFTTHDVMLLDLNFFRRDQIWFSMRPLCKRKSLYYGCKVRNRAAIIFWEDKHIEYVAPFDRCDREQDYETAWKFFEEKYGDTQ